MRGERQNQLFRSKLWKLTANSDSSAAWSGWRSTRLSWSLSSIHSTIPLPIHVKAYTPQQLICLLTILLRTYTRRSRSDIWLQKINLCAIDFTWHCLYTDTHTYNRLSKYVELLITSYIQPKESLPPHPTLIAIRAKQIQEEEEEKYPTAEKSTICNRWQWWWRLSYPHPCQPCPPFSTSTTLTPPSPLLLPSSSHFPCP